MHKFISIGTTIVFVIKCIPSLEVIVDYRSGRNGMLTARISDAIEGNIDLAAFLS